MYSEHAEEEDNKMAERWQKDADGIIIFVRASHAHYSFHSVLIRQLNRMVYSLLLSLHLLLYPFKISDPTHRIRLLSTSRKCISSKPTLIYLARPPLPTFPNLLHFLHQHMLSGSTHYGS